MANTSLTYGFLCWQRPLHGQTYGYDIVYTSLNSSQIDNVYINYTGEELCVRLERLRAWDTYKAVVYAWGRQGRGPEQYVLFAAAKNSKYVRKIKRKLNKFGVSDDLMRMILILVLIKARRKVATLNRVSSLNY